MVPITVKPLQLAEAFLLELTADKPVEWEQEGDRIQDLDQELRVRKTGEGVWVHVEDERKGGTPT